MANPRHFGTLLKRYRQSAGLTQEQLAEQAGYSTVYVGALERGQRVPLPSTVRLLADALGLAAEDRLMLQKVAQPQGGPPLVSHSAAPLIPLVARGDEIALVERYLTQTGPPVVFVTGEPGIGKTRLLQDVSQRMAEHGLRVLHGHCLHERQHSYAPLLEALTDYMRRQPPARLRSDLQGCAFLVRFIPELASGPIEPLPDWTLSPEQEERLVADAIGRFLVNIAGPSGTLLVLDDLQWAGADALNRLGILIRSVTGVPLRVLGAYRDTEMQPHGALSVRLADLAEANLAVQLTLDRLTPPDARLLFDSVLTDAAHADPALRDYLLQQAGGLPFFIVSYAQALTRDLPLARSGEFIPWNVAHSIRERVAGLPAPAQDLLELVAMAGRAISHRALAHAAGLTAEKISDALDAACHAHLLEEDQKAYYFPYNVIREEILTSLSAARRAALSERLAAAQAQEQEQGTSAFTKDLVVEDAADQEMSSPSL